MISEECLQKPCLAGMISWSKETNLVSQHQEDAKVFKHGALRDHLQM